VNVEIVAIVFAELASNKEEAWVTIHAQSRNAMTNLRQTNLILLS
jgi:hypothetical protein